MKREDVDREQIEVKLRLTPIQYQALKQVSAREGQGMAAWIRSRIHPELREEIRRTESELRR